MFWLFNIKIVDSSSATLLFRLGGGECIGGVGGGVGG